MHSCSLKNTETVNTGNLKTLAQISTTAKKDATIGAKQLIKNRNVKTCFLTKLDIGNRFGEVSCLAVFGLRDVMCHMAASPRQAAGKVKRG